MFSTGVLLTGLCIAAGYLIYRRLPASLKNFLKRHPLVTALGIGTALYFLLGTAFIGMLAATWAGSMTKAMFSVLLVGIVLGAILTLMSSKNVIKAVEEVTDNFQENSLNDCAKQAS